MQPHLLDADRPGAVEVELAVRAVGCPSRTVEEAAQRVVGGHQPGDGPLEPVGAQRVDRGLEQPAAVPLTALVGVEDDLGELAVGDRVAVGVGGRSGEGEADDPVAFEGRCRASVGRASDCSQVRVAASSASGPVGNASGGSTSAYICGQARSWSAAIAAASSAQATRTETSAEGLTGSARGAAGRS